MIRITHLVVTLESSAELADQSDEHQLADLRQLGVDNGDEGRKNGREGEGRGLSFHNRTGKQSLSSDQVFAKEFGHDVFDVGNVDLQSQR